MSNGDRQAAGLTKLDLMFVFCEGYAHLQCFRRWPSARLPLAKNTRTRLSAA
jgi:hypothetical protein